MGGCSPEDRECGERAQGRRLIDAAASGAEWEEKQDRRVAVLERQAEVTVPRNGSQAAAALVLRFVRTILLTGLDDTSAGYMA